MTRIDATHSTLTTGSGRRRRWPVARELRDAAGGACLGGGPVSRSRRPPPPTAPSHPSADGFTTDCDTRLQALTPTQRVELGRRLPGLIYP